ncbi:MAG: DUF393 domain-containing protein [Chloroflexaceae bacterium]|nr:DUF393 domain-containing protein [Chloroflexaceae bacterium]
MKPTYSMLYDGACQFCTNQANTVQQLDREQRVTLLDINSAEAAERFPQISRADAQRAMYLVAPDGTLYRGAEAVRQLLLLLPWLRGAGALMYLPGAMLLAHPLYDWVARHRYLLGGRIDSCEDGACAVEPSRTDAA